jgi:hypothetical protein
MSMNSKDYVRGNDEAICQIQYLLLLSWFKIVKVHSQSKNSILNIYVELS